MVRNKKPTTGRGRSLSYKFPYTASNDDPMMGSLFVTGLLTISFRVPKGLGHLLSFIITSYQVSEILLTAAYF